MKDKKQKNTFSRQRPEASREKRRRILNAAIQVFSQKGFHQCRISDIASAADVAYGLVYHYFENKEEILNTIFEENWGLLTRAIENVGEGPGTIEEKLLNIVSFILDAHRMVPDIIQVMVMEIARSSKLLKRPRIETFERAFVKLSEILAHHQRLHEVRADLDPKLLAYMLFGSIELILTGYLLHTLPPEKDEAYEGMKRALVDSFLRGASGLNA
ncbi:MAG: TetR/AcrR family transcriptional regulator [Myxococcales bacterium]|nr:TetR/AcrR family transcriptional regulator [Myxococcales bacterium]